MNKQQYEVKSEQLDGQIRIEMIRGKQHEVTKAKHEADAKESTAKLAGVKTQIARQSVITENHRLTQARSQTKVEQLKTVQGEQDVKQLARENPLRQKALDMKYEGMQTDVTTARKILDNRKQLHNLRGEM